MRATIKDVARAAGVNISTVSRTFSKPYLVRPETRDRILAAASSLGYRPNPAARSLVTGRTNNIGLIVADIANPLYPPLIQAAERQARHREYHVIIADTDDDPAVEEELVRTLAKQVDGILLCNPRLNGGLIEQLRLDVPLIIVNRPIAGRPAVLMDVARGAAAAIEHLIGLGHRAIALLTGPSGSWISREITRSATAVARLPGVTLTVLGPNVASESGGAAAAAAIRRTGATGVLTFNDLMAIGLIEGLESLGTAVPGDLSVVGVDDIAMSRCTRPRLTTVALPMAAAGRTAVDMLLQPNGMQAGTTVTLETELVVRESTGPVPDAARAALSPA